MNTINNETVQLVKTYEGCVLTAYADPGSGNEPWTIGYGHTGLMALPKVQKGDVITQPVAEEYLWNDLNAAGARVGIYVKTPLNDNQFGALVSFFFNVGEGTFAKSSVLQYVNDGNLDAVPGRLALYRLASGKVEPGLVRRRSAEGALWLKPVEDDVIPDPTVNQSKAQPDQNNKKPMDWGALTGIITLIASCSDDIKHAVGNFTEAFGISPQILLIVVGVGALAFTLYKKFQKDR